MSTKKKSDTAFPLAQLRANSRELFGVSVSTFDGAAASIKKESATVDEMKNAINTWLGRSVK